VRAGCRTTTRLKLPERRRRNRRILLAGLLLLVLLVGLVRIAPRAARVLGKLPLFQAGRVEVTGLLYLSPDEVRPSIPVRSGESLFDVRPAEIVASLTRNPRIESASVTLLPAAVRVSVRERRPFVLVNAGRLLEVDSTGVILPPLVRGLIADRPVVTGLSISARRPGGRVLASRFPDVLRVVTLLEEPDVGLLSEISEIVASDPRWFVLRTSRDQIPILIDPGRVTPRCLMALRATLRDLRDRDRRVLGLDARYRGQVIVRCAPDSLGLAPVSRDKV
jgi:POTRA domain-containing FtsQ-type protein